MATYGELFSFVIPLTRRSNRGRIELEIRQFQDEQHEQGIVPAFVCGIEPEGIWIHHPEGEYGDVSQAIQLVCRLQKRLKWRTAVAVEYARTCSQPTLDAFGGRGLVVRQGEIVCSVDSVDIWLPDHLKDRR